MSSVSRQRLILAAIQHNLADIAWTYDFPTRQLLPITGLIAFYNEKVDITLDDRRLERPVTHFS